MVFPCPNSEQKWPSILDKGWQHCAGGGGRWTENIRVVQTSWFHRVVPIIVFGSRSLDDLINSDFIGVTVPFSSNLVYCYYYVPINCISFMNIAQELHCS